MRTRKRPAHVHRDSRKAVRAALDAGATIEGTGGRHNKLTLNGEMYFFAQTPGDPFRSSRELRTWLRKRGIVC